jgi:hypothetical protein
MLLVNVTVIIGRVLIPDRACIPHGKPVMTHASLKPVSAGARGPIFGDPDSE